MKKYTIKDIAELAGVSKGTVDRVIHKRGKVSPAALEKVTKLLEEIDYQPNLIARSLKNTKSYHICVIQPDPKIDPYWQPCTNGVNDAINEYNSFGITIDSYFFDHTDTHSFLEVNKTVLKQSPDAVLITPVFHKESIEVIKIYNENNIIVSTINDPLELNGITNYVGQDLTQSGRIAARLMEMIVPKNRTILIIHLDEVFNNSIHMQLKEKGFKNYLERIPNSNYNLKTCSLQQTDLDQKLHDLLSKPNDISGIFVTTSKVYSVAEIVEDFPDLDIKIVGYDLLDDNIKYLKNNAIDFLINQNPKHQAYLCITQLAEYFLFDKKIPRQKLLPIDIINSENFDGYTHN
ncbi:LacI family DNA-binding transcriptional regulator [Hwangdonia lutea]|uniref:LacI family DNA-binding transcriptional regulator n=1 Tax=Hwangdonia lutea TaxID=3075823 RepID=A0AA97HQS3_9FLAO|nr:LacI family DNA-binding transcriptional regulator [Hwangdonia sp. SCSIO 19198]WOD42693.1 LacI family DNA-binding transcriptional regulator [Hwangdonia sp. SCSIO 19198]